MGGCSRRMVAVALICVGTLLLLMSVPDALRWVSLSKARSEKHLRNTTGPTPTPHAPSPTPTPSPSSPTPSTSPTPLSAILDPSPPPGPEPPVVGFPPQHIEPIRHLYASTRPKVNPEAGFNEKWAEQRELRIAESTSCAESLAAFSRLKGARAHSRPCPSFAAASHVWRGSRSHVRWDARGRLSHAAPGPRFVVPSRSPAGARDDC
jgi:hypothetical protein